MEIVGKIIATLPMTEGVGRTSGKAWKKGGFVIETQEQYPKKVAFDVFGEDRLASVPQIGDVVNVAFDVESHEWNGKWFTNVSAYKIEVAGINPNPAQTANQVMQGAQPTQQPIPSAQPTQGNEQPSDKLPF